MLKLMIEIKGIIPKKMRNQGQFVDRYFDQFNFGPKISKVLWCLNLQHMTKFIIVL